MLNQFCCGHRLLINLCAVFWVLFVSQISFAQSTMFTYQGKLSDNGAPANGNYDFQFKMFNTLSGGTQIGPIVSLTNISVTGGIFAVQLDFTAGVFSGGDCFLEIAVKPTSGGTFTTLTPRQQITSTPYAIRSLNAATADGLSVACVNCVTSSQIASLPAGSGNYIQNTTNQQATSNFNISGDGTAAGTLSGNIVNATTQFNLNGSGILSNAGTGNLFAGVGAGAHNTSFSNTFVGFLSGNNNTNGIGNSFFGSQAGLHNVSGLSNSFFGAAAGLFNTTGGDNSFFGNSAGQNSTGSSNSFFGSNTGHNTTTGASNAFFGFNAGVGNDLGSNNSFFGTAAGSNNSSGGNNTAIGSSANVGVGNLDHATAIGADAIVSSSNTVVLGRNVDSVQVPGSLIVIGTLTANLPAGSANYIQNTTNLQTTSNFNISGNGTVGGTLSAATGSVSGTMSANIVNATTQFNLGGTRILSSPSSNLFVGNGTGAANTSGVFNAFFGLNAGLHNNANNNAFFGASSGQSNTTGVANAFFGASAGTANTSGNFNSFFGEFAGAANTIGADNSFFGNNTGQASVNGNDNSFFGYQSGFHMAGGNFNAFFGSNAGFNFNSGNYNIAVGYGAGISSVSVSNDTFVGASADSPGTVSNATAIGSNAYVTQSNSMVLGSISGINGAIANTKVGIGTTAPDSPLQVNGIIHAGSLKIDTLSTTGGEAVCYDSSSKLLNFCVSSLRFKTDLTPYRNGLNIISSLHPISFTWKENGTRDLGLGAEDVAKVEPLLTFSNDKGEIMGVRYQHLNIVLINAVQEQQAQIEAQQQQLRLAQGELTNYRQQLAAQVKRSNQQQEQFAEQQHDIQALRYLVCRNYQKAAICKTMRRKKILL